MPYLAYNYHGIIDLQKLLILDILRDIYYGKNCNISSVLW
jgi:hypothetical protein